MKTLNLFFTLRMLRLIGWGPRDEKEATNGAVMFTVLDLYITACGDLKMHKK